LNVCAIFLSEFSVQINQIQKETRMTKFVTLICAAVVVAVGTAYAGDGCCPSKKAKAAAKADGCAAGFSKLNLTADQQAKVAALKADCDKEGCSETSKAEFIKGLEGILTAEQLAQCKELCAKDGKAGCAMKNTAKN
jgi:hypothetical protein